MTDLRKLARGRECQIRLPGCAGGTDTTVLCHFRMIGISGLGHKSPDWLGAHGCHLCHAKVDSDKSDAVQLAFALGVFRTQYALKKEGHAL